VCVCVCPEFALKIDIFSLLVYCSLRRFTENLSELSEKPLREMNRTEVVNQTRVVDRFMKNVLKYVEDGMED
jgi:hypothetical protein